MSHLSFLNLLCSFWFYCSQNFLDQYLPCTFKNARTAVSSFARANATLSLSLFLSLSLSLSPCWAMSNQFIFKFLTRKTSAWLSMLFIVPVSLISFVPICKNYLTLSYMQNFQNPNNYMSFWHSWSKLIVVTYFHNLQISSFISNLP